MHCFLDGRSSEASDKMKGLIIGESLRTRLLEASSSSCSSVSEKGRYKNPQSEVENRENYYQFHWENYYQRAGHSRFDILQQNSIENNGHHI